MKLTRTIVLLPGELEVAVDSLHPDNLERRLQKAMNSATKPSGTSNRKQGHVSPSTRLNQLVAALGFPSDFDRYRSDEYPRLQSFLSEHNLCRSADLITLRREREAGKKGYYGGSLSLGRQDLSERLFFSGMTLPATLFTGYDFDYWNFWDDGWHLLERLTCPSRKTPLTVPLRSPMSTMPEDVKANVELARRDGNTEIDVHHPDHVRRRVDDVVLGGYLEVFDRYFGLFGDLRTGDPNRSFNGTIDHDFDREAFGSYFHDYAEPIVELFRDRIERQRHGWVDIVQFNNSLIFLRGAKGEFDCLIRNQRDTVFDTHVYGDKLAARQLPRSLPDYRFEHWLHFDHVGWKSHDLRLGRMADQADVSNQVVHESERGVRLRHYVRTGQFSIEPRRFDAVMSDFSAIDAGTCRLAVSNLVSVDDFLAWASLPESADLPDGDDLLGPVNGGSDRSMPAAVTLHAALRFIRAEEDRLGIPFRLMHEAEYRALRKTEVVERRSTSNKPLLEFVAPDGSLFDGHPPCMPEEDFQRLHFRYGRSLDWIELANGLQAVDSDEVAEWLQEGTCILSSSLVDLNSRRLPLRKSAAGSTGKYKGLKFVFRLCYELEYDG